MDCPASLALKEVATWRELQDALYLGLGTLSISEQLVIESLTVGCSYAEVTQMHETTPAVALTQGQLQEKPCWFHYQVLHPFENDVLAQDQFDSLASGLPNTLLHPHLILPG